MSAQHKKRIGRTFALAAKPVTVEQYRRFRPGSSPHGDATLPRRRTCPVVGIVWYEAAAYCNWLSKEEGIPEDQWCYETDQGAGDEAEGELPESDGLSAADGSGDGVCDPCGGGDEPVLRGDGGVAAEVCVVHEELARTEAWPVGSMKPNDLGLFDMHGNVYTWCQESFQSDYPTAKDGESIEDKEDSLIIKSADEPCVAWRLVHHSSVERAFCLP